MTRGVKVPVGSRTVLKSGYVAVKREDGKWVLEHRVIAGAKKGELVHHDNEVRSDNTPSNLIKMTRGEHSAEHHRRQSPMERWSRHRDNCAGCGTNEREHCAKGLCNPCWQRASAKARGFHRRARIMTEACADCGLTGRRYEAHGICHACCERARRKEKHLADPQKIFDQPTD